MTADTVARLKITLDDVKPAVLRRIEVPFAIRLDQLHLAIQAAMSWTNTHLYEIRARDDVAIRHQVPAGFCLLLRASAILDRDG